MYNRYLSRDEDGCYERVVPPEAPPPGGPADYPPPPHAGPPPDLHMLDRLLDKLHLRDLDSSDLLLLLILFLLFRQEADEEVLIALGLLLIL